VFNSQETKRYCFNIQLTRLQWGYQQSVQWWSQGTNTSSHQIKTSCRWTDSISFSQDYTFAVKLAGSSIVNLSQLKCLTNR